MIKKDNMPGLSLAEIRRKYNVNKLGGVSISSKAVGSQSVGVYTYIVYLAPWKTAGFNMCPAGKHCRKFCLSSSGLAGVSARAAEDHAEMVDTIAQARKNRTLLFLKNRDAFTRLLASEIASAKRKAERDGMKFAVRINGTSDISPLACQLGDKRNIMDLFPDVQFYDYTKVIGRVLRWDREKYPLYDLTFSYDGFNWKDCQKAIAHGARVSVVMDMEQPETFHGLPVVNGSDTDVRFSDPAGCIVYLHYHKTAGDYVKINGRRVYKPRRSRFVVRSLKSKL